MQKYAKTNEQNISILCFLQQANDYLKPTTRERERKRDRESISNVEQMFWDEL